MCARVHTNKKARSESLWLAAVIGTLDSPPVCASYQLWQLDVTLLSLGFRNCETEMTVSFPTYKREEPPVLGAGLEAAKATLHAPGTS